VPASNVPVVFATQVVNFLMGHVFDPFDTHVPEGVRSFALEISGEIPEVAFNLMRQDKNLRELVVYTLRMRLVLGSVQDGKFRETQEGERIGQLLQLYGGEFQEEVDEQRYTALVNNWIAWAESPGFPVRGDH
jgi:hypothetical protein